MVFTSNSKLNDWWRQDSGLGINFTRYKYKFKLFIDKKEKKQNKTNLRHRRSVFWRLTFGVDMSFENENLG